MQDRGRHLLIHKSNNSLNKILYSRGAVCRQISLEDLLIHVGDEELSLNGFSRARVSSWYPPNPPNYKWWAPSREKMTPGTYEKVTSQSDTLGSQHLGTLGTNPRQAVDRNPRSICISESSTDEIRHFLGVTVRHGWC
jgi:hypothetical protein